jgi:hypothetical protein
MTGDGAADALSVELLSGAIPSEPSDWSASSQRRTIPAPHPALIGISRSPWQRPPAFWATLGRTRVEVRVWGVSDGLRARQGIAVLVLFDEHRQPTEPELLVPCTPCASLPIDVHIGTDQPNE